MSFKRRVRMTLLNRILHRPFVSREVEYTVIASQYDDPARPSARLIDLALKSIEFARSADMSSVSSRLKTPPVLPDIWPGEHYKLLAGIVTALQPKCIVEVGTYTGMSSLAMLSVLPEGGRIVTYDIVKWDNFNPPLLREDDFRDGRLTQRLEDLSDDSIFARNVDIMKEADLIFIDGPHDVTFEDRILAKLKTVQYENNPILLLDDTRLLGMTGVWRRIDRPKLDLTSFGHWSGTGLVDWTADKE
jgi:hypothetical protein